MSIIVFTDSRCLEHHVPYGFPELPERLEVLVKGLSQAGVEVDEGGVYPGAEEAIAAVHSADYVSRFREAVEKGQGFLDTGDNPLSPGTWSAAGAAVETSLRAADWVQQQPDRVALAAVRPPGHHAERAMAMGFCYFNNVAVTAEHLLATGAAERVAIVDYDVHHGNGTQHIFEDRAEVLYVSTHQYPFYPGTGAADERGREAGEGATVNIPLPAGSGDDQYRAAFQAGVLPALRQFAPDILLVSTGFDSWQDDPVGGMRVSELAFRQWGKWLREVADESCRGRILLVLEGGYDIEALPVLTLAHFEGLAG